MDDQDRRIAHTPLGDYAGHGGEGVISWRGIRYAQAPVGGLRWRAPVAVGAHTGILDATAFGPACPQRPNPAVPLGPDAVMDEDCLSLNVWAADDDRAAEARPVMVWVHGGAYTFGSSSQPLFDGRHLVQDGGVVLVTVNYRLGGFGFLDLTSLAGAADEADSNLAIRDVLLALEWVQANIAAFGGDPARVTVFGESAGGGIVSTLLAVPSARGLFARAIVQSSPATSVYGTERARSVAQRFFDEVGVDTIDQARQCTADRIVEASMAVYAAVPAESPGVLPFAPVVDGDLIPEHPLTVLQQGRGIPVPLMIGTNRDEATLFKYMKSPLMPITAPTIDAMFDAMAAEYEGTELPSRAQVLSVYEHARHRAVGLGIARDIGFRMPTVWLAEGHSAVAPVWLYRFDFTTPMLRLLGIGATHATELPYVWGNLDATPKDPTFMLGGRRRGSAVSRRMLARWTAFARGDAPDVNGAAIWGAYDRSERSTLVIDETDRSVPDLDRELREGWGDTVLAFR
ncbi:carboxylesterase/lipase family protein [Plantibacter flavus]